MSLFERFRSAGLPSAKDKEDTAEREALRLIDDGNAREDEGRVADALQSYETAIRLAPNLARAYLNRGNALLAMDDAEGAVAAYTEALVRNPAYAAAHYNVGNAHIRLGNREAARIAYQKAIFFNPEFADAEVALGGVLQGLGQHEEAVASYRRALGIKPDYAGAYCNLGNSLKELGKYDDAIVSYRRASEIAPDFVDAHYNLGNALKELGQLDQAMLSYRRALEVKPDFADAHANLGSVLQDLGRQDDALASYRRALEINPDHAIAHSNLGNTLQDLGRHVDAASSYRRALGGKPDFAAAHDNLLFCLSHMDALSAPELFAEHCRFGAQFEAPLRAGWPLHGNSRDPDRCLQVGFISGDLRNHAMAYFIEPLVAQLARSPALSMHAYYTHPIEDAVTKRMRGRFRHWHAVAHLSDEALAQKVGADGIDLLIDLSGHTGGNRLLCFARKPAPVQASWLGYLGTTGLGAMDYYLADRYFLPADKFENLLTEKLVYMPAVVAFLPDERAPPVNVLPALSNGYVTFGSFNRLSKLTPSAIALWSRLLRAIPDARMLLGAMPEDGRYNPLIDWFAKKGIVRERLSFHPRCSTAAYLALHHQVDVCLDTVPYTGGATTSHALWMGVPTLCLAGDTIPGRLSAAILRHVELGEFVATDVADFEQKGMRWAEDFDALAHVRAGLRTRFERSPMRQPALIAAGFECALRAMWQRWCAGLPPAMLDVSLPTNDERSGRGPV